MARKVKRTVNKKRRHVRTSSIQKTIDEGKDYVARVDQRLRIRRNNKTRATKATAQKQKKITKVTKQKRRVSKIPTRPARPSLPAPTTLFGVPPTTSLFGAPPTSLFGASRATGLFAPIAPTTGLFGGSSIPVPAARTASRNLSRSGSKNLAKTGSKNQIIQQQLHDRLGRHNANIGKLNFSLRWWDPNDLDLHVICPCGTQISYCNKKCLKCNGELDIDMNVGMNMSLQPVQHVYFNNPKPGLYKFYVRYYSGPKEHQGVRGAEKSKYALSLHEDLNQLFRYQDNVSLTQREIHYDFTR